ncbi:hypothetical protein MTO96_038551 [Rhipicephalus appendiculatus]
MEKGSSRHRTNATDSAAVWQYVMLHAPLSSCSKGRQFRLIRNRCRMYPDHGRYCLLPNRHGSARFYYDPYHGRCYGFWYYGCGGNRNNFATIQHCLQRCARRGKVPAVDDVEAGTGVVFFK